MFLSYLNNHQIHALFFTSPILYYKTILNTEIRIANTNKVYFNFLFFIIQAIDIKQSEIITNNIIY